MIFDGAAPGSGVLFVMLSRNLVFSVGLGCLIASGVAAVAAEKKGNFDPKLGTAALIEKEIAATGKVRVMITVRTGSGAAALQAAVADASKRSAAKAEIASAINTVVTKHFGPVQRVNGAGVVALKTSPTFSVVVTKAQLEKLLADPAVVSIRLDHKATKTLDVTTLTIKMPAAWSNLVTGYGRTAAVLDTGVQADHPFIGTSRVVGEACFTTDSSCHNGGTEDFGAGSSYPYNSENSHGTHVAGITMGKNTVSGATPKAGVAKVARLLAANVFDASGYTYESTMTRGLEFVEDQDIANGSWNIQAINMSIGGGLYAGYCDAVSPDFVTVVNRLRARNITLAVAAGNDWYPNAMSWPGCLSTVIAVGATNRAGNAVAYYSNLTSRTYVLAPGGDAYDDGAVVSSILGGAYDAYQGTSMATPHVTGALTALSRVFQTTKISYLEDALRRTGKAVTDTRYGTGETLPRIDVEAARAFLAAPTKPANDNFGSATTIGRITDEIWGSTSGATRQSGEPNPSNGTGNSVWWKWTPTVSQKVQLSTFGSNFNTALGVYTGTSVSALTKVASSDDADSTTKTSRVIFNAVAGTTYRIVVEGRGTTDGGTVRLAGFLYPSNDLFSRARAVTVSSTDMTLTTGNNYMASTETNEPYNDSVYTVWWKFVAPVSGDFTIDTDASMTISGSAADTTLTVFTGTSVGALTQVAFDDDSGLGAASRLTFAATAGATYYVRVGSFDWGSSMPAEYNSGPIRLTFTPPGFEYSKAKARMVLQKD